MADTRIDRLEERVTTMEGEFGDLRVQVGEQAGAFAGCRKASEDRHKTLTDQLASVGAQIQALGTTLSRLMYALITLVGLCMLILGGIVGVRVVLDHDGSVTVDPTGTTTTTATTMTTAPTPADLADLPPDEP